MIALVLLSAMVASTYTMAKLVLEFCPPITLTALRLFLSGMLFWGYHKYTKATIPAVIRSDYVLYIQVAFFAFYAPYILEFWALQYMSSAKTAFLYSLSPVVTAFLSFIFFHEKMTYKKGIGLLLSIIAVIPVLMSSAPHEGISFAYISLPEIAVLIAMMSFAYGWIVMRKAIKGRSFPIVFVNGVGMILAGIAAALTACVFELSGSAGVTMISMTASNWLTVIGGVTGLVLIGNVACYMLYGYLLRYYTATLLTFGEQSTPIFATLYGFLFLHEHVSHTFLLSMFCLVIGIFIVYQEELRQGYFEIQPK